LNVAAAGTTVKAPTKKRFWSLGRRRQAEHSVSFPELVWLHHLRQEELKKRGQDPYEGPAEQRYRRYRRWFEEEHGKIVDSYWCTDDASGVALTVKRRPLMFPDVVRLHWATDWSTKDKPKLMRLLYECETLAVKVQEVLRDTSRRLAIQSLFNVISFVLAFAETPHASDDKSVAEISRSTRAGLKEVNTFYRHAAERSGQITYVGGMLFGMLAPLLISIAGWILVGHNHSSAVGIGLLCFSAGAVGALVSVMSRLSSGKVTLDWEYGKDTLRTLGSLRPFVGAVFGLITYLALRSGVIGIDLANHDGRSYYYVVFSFAAGFSERLAQDMLLATTLESVPGRSGKNGDSDKNDSETGLTATSV